MTDLEKWIASGKHLPKFMRDFHDQKDLFKVVDHFKSNSQNITWIDASIYTVDTFLVFMAEHGYTLQPVRKPYEFKDIVSTINTTISKMKEQSTALILSMFKQKD